MKQADGRRILLHLGLRHTGAGAIQAALAANRATLAAAGVRVVEVGDEGWPLVYLFARRRDGEDGPDPRFRGLVGAQARGRRPTAIRRAEAALDAALSDPAARVVILSCEHLAEHLRWRETGALAERLKAAGPVSVIAYLREPGAYAQATADLRLRQGASLRMLTRIPPQPGWRKGLKKVLRHFGPERVALRPFQPRQLRHGDVVADFLAWAGLEGLGLDLSGKAPRPPRLSRWGALALDLRNRLVGWGAPRRALNHPPRLARVLAALPGEPFVLKTETRRDARRRSRKDMIWLRGLLGRAPFPHSRPRPARPAHAPAAAATAGRPD